jgi:hypothetical protein
MQSRNTKVNPKIKVNKSKKMTRSNNEKPNPKTQKQRGKSSQTKQNPDGCLLGCSAV